MAQQVPAVLTKITLQTLDDSLSLVLHLNPSLSRQKLSCYRVLPYLLLIHLYLKYSFQQKKPTHNSKEIISSYPTRNEVQEQDE